MSYSNHLMVELMVPRDPEVDRRITDFYNEIGWTVRDDTDSEYFTYVHPDTNGKVSPTVAYWQTENEGKVAQFHVNDADLPSRYARGLRLPHLLDLVEVCLIVPSDKIVHEVFERGGRLLEDHTHILPRDHAGKQEFRFADPFNYSLRITADPGWEISAFEGYRFSEITSSEQYLTREHFEQFRDSEPDEIKVTTQRANRAFGALTRPRDRYSLNYLQYEATGLKQTTREEAGIPAGINYSDNDSVIQVGSFLDFVRNHESSLSIDKVTIQTRAFWLRLATKLEAQLADAVT